MKPGISKSLAPFAALLLGAATLPAYAGSGKSFKDFDSNKDGYLSLEECKAKGKDDLAFKAADINGDQQVDPDEFVKYRAK